MYDIIADPYCYAGTTVLRNRLDLRDQAALEAFETDAVTLRGEEDFPIGRFTPSHYRAVHRHLFQDVYGWAGRYRSVRLSKGGNMFCYPENIAGQLALLFADLVRRDLLRGRSPATFAAEAAHFLAELNAIHAFREGNGRTQLAFFAVLADRAGHPLDISQLRPERFLAAMIGSFHGDERGLANEIRRLI